MDEDHFVKHEAKKRGVKSRFLLDPPNYQIKLPSDTVLMEMLSDGAVLPTDTHLMYWCQIFEMPKLPVHHLVRFDAKPEKGHEQYVHHIGVYQCSRNMSAYLGKGEKCFSGDGYSSNFSKMYECANRLMWFGGPRMPPTDFPDDVGLVMTESPEEAYILLEMHYENIELKPGIIDHSGVRMYLTPTLRPVEAGVLLLNTKEWAPAQIIPPGQDEFHFYSYSEKCLGKILPQTGFNMMSILLHMHFYGNGVTMHHYRNGVQLPDIATNNHYNFYEQNFRILKPSPVILPGDELVMECVYNTSKSNRTIFGGFSTLSEMCTAPVIYYPRVAGGVVCLSYPDPLDYVPMFQEGAQLIGNDTVLLTSGQNVTLVDFVNNHLDWTRPGVLEQYKQLVYNGTYVEQLIYQPLRRNKTDTAELEKQTYITKRTGYPKVTQQWIPEKEYDKCSVKMGNESASTGKEESVATTAINWIPTVPRLTTVVPNVNTTVLSGSTEVNKLDEQKSEATTAWTPIQNSKTSSVMSSVLIISISSIMLIIFQ